MREGGRGEGENLPFYLISIYNTLFELKKRRGRGEDKDLS